MAAATRRPWPAVLAGLAAGTLLVGLSARAWAANSSGRAAQQATPGPSGVVLVPAGTIQGTVANGTVGAPTPNGLLVTLHGYDDFATSVTLTATTDSAGAFAFNNVPDVAGRYYMLSVPYEGVPYSSDLLKFDASATTLNAKVQLYEATADPSALRISQLQLVFDLSSDGATVTEICLLSNTGQRTFAASGGAGLTLPVPTHAAAVTVQNQQGSINADRTGPGLQIQAPLLPGQGTAELIFTFRLLSRPVSFEQALPLAVDNLTVFVPASGAAIQGASLEAGGQQTYQGQPYHKFSMANLVAGQKIAFHISGGGPGLPGPGDPNVLIVIGLGLLNLILVAGIGVLLWRQRAARRRRRRGSTQAGRAGDDLDIPRIAD
jgi:hypothetical protein